MLINKIGAGANIAGLLLAMALRRADLFLLNLLCLVLNLLCLVRAEG